MRYYLQWSSWFDTHKYDTLRTISAIRKGGGSYIRESNQFGWSNQPKVVTFRATQKELGIIIYNLEKTLGTNWLLVFEQDW